MIPRKQEITRLFGILVLHSLLLSCPFGVRQRAREVHSWQREFLVVGVGGLFCPFCLVLRSGGSVCLVEGGLCPEQVEIWQWESRCWTKGRSIRHLCASSPSTLLPSPLSAILILYQV